VLACVIAVTLVGQGLLLPAVVRWLGLGSHAAEEREREHMGPPAGAMLPHTQPATAWQGGH